MPMSVTSTVSTLNLAGAKILVAAAEVKAAEMGL
jgi:hypothetical protein